MNCFNLSDDEFTEQVKSLSKIQMEELANSFSRKFDILRREYQNKQNQNQSQNKQSQSQIQNIIPAQPSKSSPIRSRYRSPSPRRISTGMINNLIGILEKKPIGYYGNRLTLTNPNFSGNITIILYPDYHIEYIQNTNSKELLSQNVSSPTLVNEKSGIYEIKGNISLENLSEVLSDLVRAGWNI